jgi:hypothetical protein
MVGKKLAIEPWTWPIMLQKMRAYTLGSFRPMRKPFQVPICSVPSAAPASLAKRQTAISRSIGLSILAL